MAIDEKYKRMIAEIQPIVMEKGNDWCKNFIADMADKQHNLSFAMREKIDELHRQYVLGEDTKGKTSKTINLAHTRAQRTSEGWEIYVNEVMVGQRVTRKEAIAITNWLETAYEDLTVILAGGTPLDETFRDTDVASMYPEKDTPPF
jgi:hypothetical protein